MVVDDHPIARRGLRCLIDGEPDMVVCAEAGGSRDAMQAAVAARPHAAVVDLAMAAADGLELLKELTHRWPSLVTVVCSALDERMFAERAIRAGARGFVSKSATVDQIVAAIRRALGGEVALSESAAARILRRIGRDSQTLGGKASVDHLSDRELQVFTLIGQGFSRDEIADRLFISVKTVESHRDRIKVKLCVSRSRELLRHAIQFATGRPNQRPHVTRPARAARRSSHPSRVGRSPAL